MRKRNGIDARVARAAAVVINATAADMVQQAGCGVVTPPEDAAALASAVDALAADPVLAREMGERGRAHVVEHFNRATIAATLRDVLAQSAAEGAAPRRDRRDRFLDLAVALPALAVAAPVIAASAIAIKLDSPGPVFYHGDRVGRGAQHPPGIVCPPILFVVPA